MEPSTIGLFGFILCLIASRYLAEQAFRSLPQDQKLILMDGFSATRAFASLLLILAVMFGLPKIVPNSPFIGLYCGFALLIIYVIGMHVYVVSRLRKLGVDENYQRSYLVSRHVSHLGVLCLFGSLLYDAINA